MKWISSVQWKNLLILLAVLIADSRHSMLVEGVNDYPITANKISILMTLKFIAPAKTPSLNSKHIYAAVSPTSFHVWKTCIKHNLSEPNPRSSTPACFSRSLPCFRKQQSFFHKSAAILDSPRAFVAQIWCVSKSSRIWFALTNVIASIPIKSPSSLMFACSYPRGASVSSLIPFCLYSFLDMAAREIC